MVEEQSIFQKIAGYVGSYAPGIATLLAATGVGTPIAAAVGAIGALAKTFGLPETTKPEDILTTIQSMPDSELKLKFVQAEQSFQLAKKEQELKETQLQLVDVQNARNREISVKDNINKVLAYAIVGAFIAMVGATLLGHAKVESVLAGTLVGYLSAKCEQILAYYFGSSKSGNTKTSMIYNSVPTNKPKKDMEN